MLSAWCLLPWGLPREVLRVGGRSREAPRHGGEVPLWILKLFAIAIVIAIFCILLLLIVYSLSLQLLCPPYRRVIVILLLFLFTVTVHSFLLLHSLR